MRHHKHAKRIIKNFLLLIIPFILLAMVTTSTEKSIKAENDELVVSPRKTPNPPPKKFIGIWMTNGYGLQPNPDYYTTVGDPVVIRTDAGRSIWTVILGVFDSAHYRWWQTTDGKKWTEVSKSNNGHRKNFEVKPDKVGTVWYQLDTQYYTYLTPYLKTHIYSNLTAVHTLEDPVDATDLTVTVDDDYLYSTKDELSNTTYAHAHPDPANATGKIKWSVNDTSLATIDPDDGHITANKNNKSGDVEVIATMTNPNTAPISNHAIVTVGGGLDDRKVNSGETATFELRGDTAGDGDDGNSGSITIDWYKNEKKISSGTADSYTTSNTTMADDGSLFHAVINFKKSGITRSITTNQAKLTVIPSSEPDIEITNNLINKSFSHEKNDNNILNDVTNSDNVIYQDTITNISDDGPLKDAFYVVPLHSGTQINSVKVNGETLSAEKDYTVIFNSDTDTDDLTIELNTMNGKTSKDIEIDTTVAGVLNTYSLEFKPYVYGFDSENRFYSKEGTDETINYLSDKIHAQIKKIDFGQITPYSKDTLLHRPQELNESNIVDVNDQRRDKSALKAFVSQKEEFLNDNNDILPASLRYYENGSYQNVLGNQVKVSETDVGSKLSSLAWKKEDGLLLHINGNHLPAGQYSTTLTWTLESSI